MKTFTNMAAQGDLLIRRIGSIPDGATLSQPCAGVYVVAHSETGHNHVVDASPSVIMYDSPDPLVSYLRVIEASDATETIIRHLRDFDTHEPIKVPLGVYEIRRQREYIPQGFRRAAD